MRSRTQKFLPLWLGALALAASACSTTQVRPAPTAPAGPIAAKLPTSSIELTYALGHGQRKLLLRSEGAQALGQNLLQKQILQEGRLEPPQYDGYFLKVEDYCSRHLGATAPGTSSPDSCRNTYQLVLKRGEKVCRAEGCRGHTPDDAALSHLIREGEFLLARSGASTAPHTSATDSKKP